MGTNLFLGATYSGRQGGVNVVKGLLNKAGAEPWPS